MDSPTPCVAEYGIICAAILVIDPVRQMVWSYWHVDLYATPPQPTPPPLLPVSANTPPTSVSPADRWLSDCFRLVALDPTTTVESPSTDSLQRPCAAMSPSSHLQSPSTLLPSLSPCALSAFHDDPIPPQLDNLQRNSILQVEADTPSSSSDPLDSICFQVPEHIRVLFLSTVQDNHLSQPLATGLRDRFLDHADTFATGPADIGYSDLLQRDIDTGDTFPIKQSPCRPPLCTLGRGRHLRRDARIKVFPYITARG